MKTAEEDADVKPVGLIGQIKCRAVQPRVGPSVVFGELLKLAWAHGLDLILTSTLPRPERAKVREEAPSGGCKMNRNLRGLAEAVQHHFHLRDVARWFASGRKSFQCNQSGRKGLRNDEFITARDQSQGAISHRPLLRGPIWNRAPFQTVSS